MLWCTVTRIPVTSPRVWWIHPDGRLVHFMIGNKGAAEAIDKTFGHHRACIVSHGKMFNDRRRGGIIIFKNIATCSGWRRNIAHYRDIQAALDAALVEVKFMKELPRRTPSLAEKDARLAEKDVLHKRMLA
jgi:hypothetical protein